MGVNKYNLEAYPKTFKYIQINRKTERREMKVREGSFSLLLKSAETFEE
jgi:hypothetical protein